MNIIMTLGGNKNFDKLEKQYATPLGL